MLQIKPIFLFYFSIFKYRNNVKMPTLLYSCWIQVSMGTGKYLLILQVAMVTPCLASIAQVPLPFYQAPVNYECQ